MDTKINTVIRVALGLLVMIVLNGCTDEALNDKVVWTKEGCAYVLKLNMLGTLYALRSKEADRSECHE